MEAQSYRDMIPLTVLSPDIGADILQTIGNIELPWEGEMATDDRDWDQLYYDNIGKYENENEV